jgi:hypothetical protein
MVRSRSPISAIVTMALLGTVVCAIARFGYSAYVINQEGVALSAVPLKLLLTDIMELHWFAVYGFVGGAVFGIVLVLTDLVRSSGHEDGSAWKDRVDVDPFADDEVKARRMQIGDRYLKENPPGGEKGDTK